MSGTGRVRGDYAKTARRRRDILEAGVKVFSASGYRSGSIREIAQHVGMSQAGLLHHFATKAELLVAVLELRDEDSIARMRIDDGVEGGARFLRGMVQVAEYNQSAPGLIELHCLLSAEATAHSHPAHGYFSRRYEWVIRRTIDSLDDMATRGQLRPNVDTDAAARSLVALMDGLQVQWLLDRDSVDIATEVRRFLASIVAPGIEMSLAG